MRQRTRILLVALACALLFLFAYSPLLQAGLLGEDVRILVEAPDAEPLGPGPLARLSVVASRDLWGLEELFAGGRGPGLMLRLENLFLLLLAAAGLGRFTRRLFLPWVGTEQAGFAALGSALLFAVFPLNVAAVAGLASRDELLGAALGLWSAACFLRGRQDRQFPFTMLAVFLALLAGLASETALGLPFLLMVAEFLSAHRYRPKRVRLRTAATTLVVFGLASSAHLILRLIQDGTSALPAGLRALHGSGPEVVATGAIEKLGFLVLPSNPLVFGLGGTALAGVLFLVAMHPVLVAARTAPRFWSWLLFVWFLALLGSLVLHAHTSVTPASVAAARSLLPSVIVMALGLGIFATALSGVRRAGLIWIVAIGYALLAHGNARPWRSAARATRELRADIRSTQELHGREGEAFRTLVIDPPRAVQGVEPVGRSIAWLAHPSLGGDDADESGTAPPEVRGLTRPAFFALVRQPEFAALREEPLVVLVPRAEIDTAGKDDAVEASERAAVRLAAPRASGPTRTWRGDLRSPPLDLEALETAALAVTAPLNADVEGLGTVSWRTRSGELPAAGQVKSTWHRTGDGYQAVFDLGASLSWLLGGRIRLLLFEGGTSSMGQAEALERMPGLGVDLAPEVRGDDWVFARPEPASAGAGLEGEFVLGLLDVEELSYVELRPTDSGDRLRFPGVARRVAAAVQRGGGPVAWCLDYRIDGHTVARASGR